MKYWPNFVILSTCLFYLFQIEEALVQKQGYMKYKKYRYPACEALWCLELKMQ